MKFCPECGGSVKLEQLYPEWGEPNLILYGCEKCNILWECHDGVPTLRSNTKYYNKHTSRSLSEWESEGEKERRAIGVHECSSKIIKRGKNGALCERCDGA